MCAPMAGRCGAKKRVTNGPRGHARRTSVDPPIPNEIAAARKSAVPCRFCCKVGQEIGGGRGGDVVRLVLATRSRWSGGGDALQWSPYDPHSDSSRRIVLLGARCGTNFLVQRNADWPLALLGVIFCDYRELYIAPKFPCGPPMPHTTNELILPLWALLLPVHGSKGDLTWTTQTRLPSLSLSVSWSSHSRLGD